MNFTELEKASAKEGIVETVVEYTPALAKHILEELNPINRTIKQSGVKRIARNIRENTFISDMGSIRFLRNYNNLGPAMADGQHRLLAIAETGIPTKVLTRFNISDQEWKYLDSGIARSESDRVKMMYGDIPYPNRIKAVLTAYEDLMQTGSTRPTIFADDIQQFYVDNREIIDLLNDVLDNKDSRTYEPYGDAIKNTAGLSSAPVKACLFLASQKYPNETREFLKAFATGGTLNTQGPALLSNYLLKSKTTRKGHSSMRNDVYFAVLWCLKSWIENNTAASVPGYQHKDKKRARRKLISFFDNDNLYRLPGQEPEVAASDDDDEQEAA